MIEHDSIVIEWSLDKVEKFTLLRSALCRIGYRQLRFSLESWLWRERHRCMEIIYLLVRRLTSISTWPHRTPTSVTHCPCHEPVILFNNTKGKI